jgi:hypothetical protein
VGGRGKGGSGGGGTGRKSECASFSVVVASFSFFFAFFVVVFLSLAFCLSRYTRRINWKGNGKEQKESLLWVSWKGGKARERSLFVMSDAALLFPPLALCCCSIKRPRSR